MCVVNTIVFANQELDNANYKFYYKLEFQFDTLKKNDVRNDFIVLLVGNSYSKSFSYYSYKSDSLRNTPDGDLVARRARIEAMQKAKTRGDKLSILPFQRGITPYVYKSYLQNQMIITDNINTHHYKYKDELYAQTWQITDSTKTIMDYPCQMAVSDFRGRRWIAWFAHDIPISDGPWKFSGLPGLIMEVYDSEKHFHFTLVGIEEVDDEPIVFSPVVLSYNTYGEYEKTTRIDFLKGLARYHGNMISIMNVELGKDTFDESRSNVRHNDLMERDYRR